MTALAAAAAGDDAYMTLLDVADAAAVVNDCRVERANGRSVDRRRPQNRHIA